MTYTGPSGTEGTYYATPKFEKVYAGGGGEYRSYIYAGSRPVVVVMRNTAGAIKVRSLLVDHRGSISSIVTDSTGASLVSERFTAYGSRREASTWNGAPTSGELATMNGVTREGYTFQTVLGSMGLNHMNGRIEDSVTGRFLSPDPRGIIRGNTQSWNRYSYVNNNPLSFVDPSGFGPGCNCWANTDPANPTGESLTFWPASGSVVGFANNVIPNSALWLPREVQSAVVNSPNTGDPNAPTSIIINMEAGGKDWSKVSSPIVIPQTVGEKTQLQSDIDKAVAAATAGIGANLGNLVPDPSPVTIQSDPYATTPNPPDPSAPPPDAPPPDVPPPDVPPPEGGACDPERGGCTQPNRIHDCERLRSRLGTVLSLRNDPLRSEVVDV
jgi:RHS repeat-associated protein